MNLPPNVEFELDIPAEMDTHRVIRDFGTADLEHFALINRPELRIGDLVRIDGLPFMQRVPGLPEDLPRGRKVLLQIMGCDLVDLVMDSRLLRVLDETADTSDEDEDEEAALEEQAAVEGGEEAQGGDTVSESSAS